MPRDPFEEADIESGGMPGELEGTFPPSFVRKVRAANTVKRMANDGTIHPDMFTGTTPMTPCKQCGAPMNPVETMVSGKHGVCGSCTRANQEAVTGGS